MSLEDRYDDFRPHWVMGRLSVPFRGYCPSCRRDEQMLLWRALPGQSVMRATCLDPQDCGDAVAVQMVEIANRTEPPPQAWSS